ncbi:MAG: DUF4282 domain-containing protein [Alphaproteobacteria bacterium]|nr:DUF4282 domain-containing protein [Alphaproteobacteria bacterium]
MDGIIKRFTSFDKLIATSLIKLLYWIGIVFIAIGVVVGALGAFRAGFMAGVGGIIIAPIAGVIGLIFWRFLCEIYIVLFGMYDRLGDIKSLLEKESA